MLENLDPKVIAAVIAAITSLVTFIVTQVLKSPIERRLHKFKLITDFENEQKSKIKSVLSTHKVPLIQVGEKLNGRFKNLMKNHELKWHHVNGDFTGDHYYFKSFIYRILSFLAWTKITEKSLIYLDTTIATDEDLNLIKYLKVIYRCLQFGKLTKESEDRYEKLGGDVIYRDKLDEMAISLIKEGSQVMTYSEFKEELNTDKKFYESICIFLDGASPEENRKRWDRLCCMHLSVMCFLNSYGYDFQYAEEKNFRRYIELYQRSSAFENYIELIKRYKLENDVEIKKLIPILEEYIAKEKRKL